MIKKFLNRLKRTIPLLIVFILIILLLLVFFWNRIVITINSGEAGVLYQRLFGGTVTDFVYDEGIHLVLPWDTMYIYNVRIQTKLHDFEVLTNRGLPITLTLAIRYRPEYETVGLLHQQVGPDYVNTIIVPQIESELRKQIGHYNPEDIYVNKENILTEIFVSALDELAQKYVKVNDVVIRAVTLPPEIKQAIENKLIEEQLHQAYVFKLKREEQEAERKRIEARGIRDYQEIISKTLNDKLIKWQGIQATLQLSESENAKVVIIGGGKDGLPIIGNVPIESNEMTPSP